MSPPRVLVLNGGSSAGKSSVARELQTLLEGGWLRLGVDTLIDAAPPSLLDQGGLVLSGDGAVAFGPILPQFKPWALPEDPVKFDPADSKKLLEAAGLGNGYDDDLIYAVYGDADHQIGEVIKAQLAKIGLRVTLKPMEVAAYFNKTYAYDYTLSHHPPRNNPEPDENLVSYFGPTATFYRWGNKEIHALIDKQAETLDFAERQKIVTEAQRKIVLDYPMSFIYSPNAHYFTHSKVKGWFYPNDLYNGRLETVWIDPTASGGLRTED